MYVTEPSGAFAEWKANAIGKKNKEVREFLEEHYQDGLNEEQAVTFAVKCLLEVVESEKSMEVCIVRAKEAEILSDESLAKICNTLKAEKEAVEAARKAKRAAQEK